MFNIEFQAAQVPQGGVVTGHATVTGARRVRTTQIKLLSVNASIASSSQDHDTYVTTQIGGAADLVVLGGVTRRQLACSQTPPLTVASGATHAVGTGGFGDVERGPATPTTIGPTLNVSACRRVRRSSHGVDTSPLRTPGP